MPERIFKYEDVPGLIQLAGSLARAITTGSTAELRNNHTGWLKTVKALTPVELRNALRDVRFEIYWRGNPPDGSAPDAQCAQMEPHNPLHEKVMAVESLNRVPAYMQQPSGANYW